MGANKKAFHKETLFTVVLPYNTGFKSKQHCYLIFTISE